MPAVPFDRRLTPARPDLAADHLRGLVDAPRYAIGQAKRVIAASAPLRRYPDADAPLETEALHGESVTVYDESEGWAWVQLDRDQLRRLSAGARRSGRRPSRRIGSPRCAPTPIPAPASSCRRAWRCRSARGSRSSGREGDFAVSADGLHLWARHLAESGCARTGLCRGRRALSRDALSLGRPDVGGDRLLGPRPDRARRRRRRLAARQRHAGGRLGRAHRHRRSAHDARARRSRVLEGPCRDHARSRDAPARQRLAHEGGQRTARAKRATGSPPTAAAM